MSELNDFINAQHERDIELTRSLATIAQSQKDMSARLFGGEGQVGVLPYMIQTAKETAKEQLREVNLVTDRVGVLEKRQLSSRSWLAGAVAVFVFEGTALGLYFSKIAAHVSTIQQALKH
jgi:hypothetical protein